MIFHSFWFQIANLLLLKNLYNNTCLVFGSRHFTNYSKVSGNFLIYFLCFFDKVFTLNWNIQFVLTLAQLCKTIIGTHKKTDIHCRVKIHLIDVFRITIYFIYRCKLILEIFFRYIFTIDVSVCRCVGVIGIPKTGRISIVSTQCQYYLN